ncbi:MAG TPA: hypothetical protein PLM22_02895 [Candidatus Sabulitectum sp.]|nr:hypothetical protein [Candidatus Sabulitectum sp.]HPF31970.1 hypothetical protein [Candidatus Sabulitectum sp.]HPJ27854.1 hypothetical protein [Candidatus Sabulitectum sp.]HPR21998.1 hypothetical protein [Candidatus Sabulitectum sp.]
MADDRMAPFSTGGFFLVQLALMIPFVNFILLLVFAFGGSVNVNLQNYSRAILIWMLIGIGLALILGVVGAIAAGGLGAYLDNLSTQYK